MGESGIYTEPFRASVLHVLFRCLLYKAVKIANELMNSCDARVSIVESLNKMRAKNSDASLKYALSGCSMGM